MAVCADACAVRDEEMLDAQAVRSLSPFLRGEGRGEWLTLAWR